MRRILLVSGSTRALSTNTAFVRTAALCAPPSVETFRHGLTALPHFDPDDDRDPPSVAALRAGIATADVGPDGIVTEPRIRAAITDVLRTLA